MVIKMNSVKTQKSEVNQNFMKKAVVVCISQFQMLIFQKPFASTKQLSYSSLRRHFMYNFYWRKLKSIINLSYKIGVIPSDDCGKTNVL